MRRKGDPVPSIEYLRSLYTGAKAPDNEWCARWSGVWGLRRAWYRSRANACGASSLAGLQTQQPS